MPVFVIDFLLVPIWWLLLFLQEYLQDHHSMSGTCMLKHHTVNSLLSADDSFPVPNVCTCNAVKIPIMSLKCCEKSYISCSLYYVGWRKYLNCSDVFAGCWHTDIHLLYFVYIWLHYLRSGGQRSKQHMKFWFYSLSISYRLNCFIYDCHNWWNICSFLHKNGIIVFQGQSSRSLVKHCCSC